MKRMNVLFGAAALLAAMSLVPSESLGQAADQPFSPSVIKVTPFAYACIPHQGPYTAIEEVIAALMAASQGQNIHPSGPLFGVYYNSPVVAKPEELVWEIGFPVTAQAVPEAPLVKKVWEYKEVARAIHVGPYEKAGDTIMKLGEWIASQGYTPDGPVFERYLDMNPNQTDPAKLRTEIWIPVRR
jgi:effector-binding domain-containing protein